MKIIYRHVLKSFVGPFITTFSISIFILLMQFLWQYVDEMAGKGLEMNVILEMMFYASFSVLPLAFPIATLIASIMTFGALGENYELLAMKAAGISLKRIMKPIFFTTIFISLFAFYFANNILPQANLKFFTLLYSVKEQRPELILQEGVFTNEIDGYSIKMGSKNKTNNMLYDLLIYDHTRNRNNESVTVADSGMLRMTEDKKYMILTLFNGANYSDNNSNMHRSSSNYPFRRDKFKKQLIRVRVDNFEFNRRDENIFKNTYRMLNINQLSYMEDSLLTVYKKRINEHIKQQNINPVLTKNLKQMILSNDTTLLDEDKRLKDVKFEFDTLFVGLDTWVQEDIVHSAIANARSNMQNLNLFEGQLNGRKKMLNRYTIERFRKFTLSLAILVFFFIGAPLGAIIRKGGLGMPVVVSILLFISYHIVSMMGEKSAREDVWNMAFGMWFSTLIFLPIGIWLTYKAVNDSAIMRSETYMKIFSKLSFLKKKKLKK